MFTLLLTWTAGCLDAISYMRFTVFPANMTGNTVLIGIGISTGQVEHILLSGVALLAYCLGVFLAAIVIKRDEKQYPWTGRFLATLIIETLALLSFAFLFISACIALQEERRKIGNGGCARKAGLAGRLRRNRRWHTEQLSVQNATRNSI